MKLTKKQKYVIEQIGCGNCHISRAVGNTRAYRDSLDYLNAVQSVHPSTVDALERRGFIKITSTREAGRTYYDAILTADGQQVFNEL